jgi:hypothetical protein
MTKPTSAQEFEFLDPTSPSQRQHADVEESRDVARWKAAEDRLYPLITVDADLYEAAVVLVCEVLDTLRSQCGTVADLSGADPEALMRRGAPTSALSEHGFDARVVFDAACALRWRELTAPGGAELDVQAR